MKRAYFLKGLSNNVFRIECLKCHASVIINETDSAVVERESQAFCRNHRLCIRKRPTQVEIWEAEDRADLEVSTCDNSN